MSQTANIPLGNVEAQPTWSHEEVVAHRLATGVQTLCTVKTPIESVLSDFFAEKKAREWTVVVKKLARALPHGQYSLKPEFYGILKPDTYPFEDDEDRDNVIRMVKEYQQSTETQAFLRRPRNKRSIVIDKGDEGNLGVAKRNNPSTKASVAQESVSDASSTQSQSDSCRSLDTSFNLLNSDNSQGISESVNLELHPGHDLQLKATGTSTLEKEIDILTMKKSKLQTSIEKIEKLKSKALCLQQKVAKGKRASRTTFEKTWTRSSEQLRFNQGKDNEIKQLRASNSGKDLQMASLQEDLRKAQATIQHQTNAIRALQTQQQLSQKQAQIEALNFELAEVKYARATAERRATEADQKYRYLLKSTGVEYERAISVQKQLADAISELKCTKSELEAAQLREEIFLAEDEKKVRERRAAMEQRRIHGDSQQSTYGPTSDIWA